MALKELPGGELYDENGGSYANEATARRHEAIHRQLSGQVAAAMDEARRPQFADNGDGTITLMTSTTIIDAGDGTLTIGA